MDALTITVMFGGFSGGVFLRGISGALDGSEGIRAF